MRIGWSSRLADEMVLPSGFGIELCKYHSTCGLNVRFCAWCSGRLSSLIAFKLKQLTRLLSGHFISMLNSITSARVDGQAMPAREIAATAWDSSYH